MRGLFDASGGQPVGGLNFDAHADVRNKSVISSGTPFGKLLREGFLAGPRFTEIDPLYDRDNQTARLVVTIVTAFITGVAASLTQAR